MVINNEIERDIQLARELATKTGKRATVGRITHVPAFDGRKLPMDERKRLMREIGGEERVS